METKGQIQWKMGKILFISLVLLYWVVLSPTAYAQQIQWLGYDDFWVAYDNFNSPAKSQKLWDLRNTNMCSDHLSYFQGGKMFQKADVDWFSMTCYFDSASYQNRVRTVANPKVAPYIFGLAATVKVDEFDNYWEQQPAGNWVAQNNLRSRLAAIFYNDGVLPNDKSGYDGTSEIYASIEIREYEVRWYVGRMKDKLGITGDNLAGGRLLHSSELGVPNFAGIRFDLKLWFDGLKTHFSAQVQKSTGEIIELTSVYTPIGKILPPKSSPLKRLETLIDVLYLDIDQPILPNKDPGDHSYIKAEWDNVSVAVDAKNLYTVQKIIRDASK